MRRFQALEPKIDTYLYGRGNGKLFVTTGEHRRSRAYD
jgi:hypothetical protein